MYNSLAIKKAYPYIKSIVTNLSLPFGVLAAKRRVNNPSREDEPLGEGIIGWGSPVMQGIVLLCCLWFTWQNVAVRWSEAEATLTGMIPILGVVGAGMLVWNRRQWHWTSIDSWTAAWTLWWLLRLWIGGEYPCGTTALKVMGMVLLYVVLRLCLTGCGRNLLTVWAFLLLGGGVVEAIWGMNQMVQGASRHSNYLLTGNFLNPGPYSAYLMIGAVVGICCTKKTSYENEDKNENKNEDEDEDPSLTPPRGRIYPLLTMIIKGMTLVCLVMLPATWSRAAWVGTGMLALWLLLPYYRRWRWWVWGGLLVLAILVFYVKQGSAEGRLIIWTSALTSWGQQPLLGFGIGGFKHACAEGMAMLYARDHQALDLFRSAGVSEYSFNALVQVLVEQGAIGAVLCLGWTFTLLWRLYRTSRSLFAGILALLLFSCFSYPFEMLPYSIILVVSTALCASAHTPKEEEETPVANTRWEYALTLGIVATLLSLPLRSETLKRQEAAQDAELVTGMHDPFFLKDCWELLPTERDNPRFLFNMAKMLEQKERWRDSNAILRMGTQVCGDPMFYVLMGNNYRKMEMNDLAEEAYRKAFAILPNRMYPLYQLMLLYKETDRQEEALQIARQIFEMRPKVKSPATDEMQEKAKELQTSTP